MRQNEEMKQLTVETLAKRLMNLEYQMANQDHLTEDQLEEVEKNYALDKASMIQLFLVTAKDMGYSLNSQDWPDSKPMEAISKMSNHELARTNAYQETLGAILLGAGI